MDLAEALRRRRMVRSFSSEPVDRARLDQVLGAARRVPSAGNSDGIDMVVLQGDDRLSFWSATSTADWRANSKRFAGMRRAPVVVVLFASADRYVARYAEPDKAASGLGHGEAAWPVPYWFVDAGCVLMVLLLASVDAGIDACFLGNFRGEQQLSAALGVPAGRRYVGAVLLGHGDGQDSPSPSALRGRRAMRDAVHHDLW
ncbi:MAG: nitroreductase family protein [Acidimicrobiales bacterium]